MLFSPPEENKPVQNLTIWDFILTPIYLIILITIARWQREKLYPESHTLRKYFLPALLVKLFGAIFIALVYEFYYGGFSDSFNFFNHSKIINSSLNDSVNTWFKLIFRRPLETSPELYPYVSNMYWYVRDPSSYFVSVISAVFGLLNGTTYLPIALLFAYFSFTGSWALFRTFVNIYPTLHKNLAIAFLFIPSVFVWGSGLFKDTVCIFSLGWLTYTVFRIFIYKEITGKNLFLLLLSFYLIAIIKVYILLAFIPAICFWLLLTYSGRISSMFLKTTTIIIFAGIMVGGLYLLSMQFSKELNKYSLEKIAETANVTRGWISYVSEREGGSGYDLGAFDGSFSGMLSKFPAAVIVTLFRPFIWEANKVIVLLSALEALIFSFFTIKIFTKNGLRAFRLMFSDPNIIFFLVFSLVFSFAVGITSYNFGALSRYKIPCLPFYAAFLVLLLYKEEKQDHSEVR